MFTNTSTGGGLSFEWDFGDGSPASSVTNPSHTFRFTGTFTVTLTVSNSLGSDVAAAAVEITEHQLFLPLMLSIATPGHEREIGIVGRLV
jgi:PKD repeat protein